MLMLFDLEQHSVGFTIYNYYYSSYYLYHLCLFVYVTNDMLNYTSSFTVIKLLIY